MRQSRQNRSILLSASKYFQTLYANSIFRNLILMLVFGILSYLFGLITFYVPGIEGTTSDLREIPLLISAFYLTNPIYTLGVSAISSLSTPVDGSYFTSITMHSVALFISWYFFNYLKKQKLSVLVMGAIFLVYVFVYYLVLLLPILIITNYIVGMNIDKSFVPFYLELITATRFEAVSSAIIISLYLIQHKYKQALKMHLINLEGVVKERTAELNSTIQELKSTQQYLIQNEKMTSLGTLSAGVAHEINNPLNFISGGVSLISDIKDGFDKKTRAELKEQCEAANEIINEGLERATGIVQALMAFSRKGTSTLILTDIHEVIENILLFMNYNIPKGVSIEKDYKLNTKIPIYVEKIHQVINNILDNAIFELKNEHTKKRVIAISTDVSNNYAVIRITNNGPKIPKHNLTQIFDPFFTSKDPGEGVGLGLSITYALVQEHNGRISAENTASGVSFTIELPLKSDQ